MTDTTAASPSVDVAPSRISVTRALKNARYLQKVAPHIMPTSEPPKGFGSVIPLKVLAQLHRKELRAGLDPHITELLKDIVFPEVRNLSGDPLFNGTLYFAQIKFTVQNQGNAAIEVSEADLDTAIAYAVEAAAPISAYAHQYGPNAIGVHSAILSYSVTLPSASYNDAQLVSWIDAIATANGLSSNACIVVLNPQNVTNTDASRATSGGYHSISSVPYIFVNLFGQNQNLTVKDEAFAYAQILSHEIAEMVVDPRGDGTNPEVCDGCGPNCQNVYLDYFDSAGHYIKTAQGWPANFAYSFYINAIVKPASATACPAPATACNYAPPIVLPPGKKFQHVLDAEWLIQLWLAIHGGDPAPYQLRVGEREVGLLATVRLIAALARCLENAHVERAVIDALKPIVADLSGKLREEL